MEQKRHTLKTSVCRRGAVEERKSVGRSRCARTLPASSMVEVIWHQHAYEPQRLNEHYYLTAMPLHATELPGDAKINHHHIVLVIRTRPVRLAS
jgi:hypothetical protein